MPYVVTQSCCADASCVFACPVNCIHPAPGEPGFATAEMLYVDPSSCVDCGACRTACPVDAISPHTSLSAEQQPFIAINAEYYDVFPHRDRTPMQVVTKQRRLTRTGPFRVAVVGSGPAGMYTADELLRHPEVTVDVLDRLPTPYGLVRAGVAPDHPHTKRIDKLFGAIESQPGFRYLLGVEVGVDVTLAELETHYDAVVYAVGAAADRPLGVPGEELAGSLSATELVGWYNGHPDRQDLDVVLDAESNPSGRVVVVGNGNVALDVARILSSDPERLLPTDIAALPWTALRRSAVREVVVLGRRGPAEAAFTVPELVGLRALAEAGDVRLVVDLQGAVLDPDSEVGQLLATPDVELVETREGVSTSSTSGRSTSGRSTSGRSTYGSPAGEQPRTIVLRFLTSPVRILGDDGRVTGVELVRNELKLDAAGVPRPVATGEVEILDAGMVLRAVGYHGHPVADLPYDAVTGTVPHDAGRVRPGVYVAGWVKRGPTGFIGTNKTDAQDTVESVLDDLDAGLTTAPVRRRRDLLALLAGRGVTVVGLAGWQAIDAEERRRGAERGRPRSKIVDVPELLRAAASGRRTPVRIRARNRR